MVKYNVSDIISKAKSLSDIENSKFISDKEALMYVNDEYVRLYQKLIDRGDTSFVRTIHHLSTGVYDLPSDFYQLKAIKTIDGSVIIHKGNNDVLHSSRYEIKNGQLCLYNCQDVIVEYWPQPQTLTFSLPDIEISGVNAVLAFGNYVITKDTSNDVDNYNLRNINDYNNIIYTFSNPLYINDKYVVDSYKASEKKSETTIEFLKEEGANIVYLEMTEPSSIPIDLTNLSTNFTFQLGDTEETVSKSLYDVFDREIEEGKQTTLAFPSGNVTIKTTTGDITEERYHIEFEVVENDTSADYININISSVEDYYATYYTEEEDYDNVIFTINGGRIYLSEIFNSSTSSIENYAEVFDNCRVYAYRQNGNNYAIVVTGMPDSSYLCVEQSRDPNVESMLVEEYTSYTAYEIRDYDGHLIKSLSSTELPIINDEDIFIVSKGTTTDNIKDITGDIILGDLEVGEDDVYYICDENMENITPFSDWSVRRMTENGRYYYIKNGRIMYKEGDDYGYVGNKSYAVTLSRINAETGYGAYGTEKIISYWENTALNYPNSMFYTLLAYYVALTIRNKQQADTTQLLAEIDRMEKVFFDTYSNDSFDYPIITNVY